MKELEASEPSTALFCTLRGQLDGRYRFFLRMSPGSTSLTDSTLLIIVSLSKRHQGPAE
jgi:hypothetical protein